MYCYNDGPLLCGFNVAIKVLSGTQSVFYDDGDDDDDDDDQTSKPQQPKTVASYSAWVR